MRQKGYSIINQINRAIKREERKNMFKYLPDVEKNYIHWTAPQLLTTVFTVLWTIFSGVEFYKGIAERNEALLSEAFHSFFHALCGGLSLFALCYTSAEKTKDHRYPYGRRKLNILAGFINGLNGIFSAFFVLVKQSHVFLDETHHEEYDNSQQEATNFYTNYVYLMKAMLSILMLFRLRRYFIYVTNKRNRYVDVKGKRKRMKIE